MDRGLLREAIKLNKERKRRKRWNHVVKVLAGVVVFCTTYALILPAITLEKQPICGMEEHEHSESCYEMQTELQLQCPYESGEAELHVHEEECYTEVQTLICGQAEEEEHIHDEACYAEGQKLICEMVEGEEHIHDESCYEEGQTLICEIAEEEAHTHSEACYENCVELTCMLPTEHEHTESCYVEVEIGEPLLVCTLTEHQHEEGCYPLEKKPEILMMLQNDGIATIADDATVTINIIGWNQLQFTGGNQFSCPIGSTVVLAMSSPSANYSEQNGITVTGGEIVSVTSSCDDSAHNHTDGFWCTANLTHQIKIKVTSANVNISGTTNWGWSVNTWEINESEDDSSDDPILPPEEPILPDSEYRSVITGTVHINRLRFYNLCENGDSGVSALADCIFEIKGSNGYTATVTSKNDVEIELPEDIPDGEFTITEISVPAGYMRDTRYERSFTIENGALTSSHNIGTFINHSLEQLEAEKTAEVEDYNNRIYEILLTAESHMRMYQMDSIDMLFVVDQSNSMLFPAGLNDTGKSVELRLDGQNNVQNMNALNLDQSQMYYLISDPSGTSTVWSVWYENGAWLYQDTSYFVKAEQQNGEGYQDPDETAIFPQNRSYQEQKDAEADGTRSNGGGLGFALNGSGLGNDIDKETNDRKTYQLYTAMVDEATKEKYNRLHYLEEALANMIYALADINPENRVTLVGFTKEIDAADCAGPYELTSENAETLVDAVRSINTSGGTRQDIALHYVYDNYLNNSNLGYGDSADENYTILITDGAPVRSSGSEIDNLGSPNDPASTTANSVYAQIKGYANLVKTKSTLMTVGLGMEHVEAGKQVLEEIATNDSFYCALDDASELVHTIQTMLFEGFKPKEYIDLSGDIVDEISNSFYPIAWTDSGRGEATGRKVLVKDSEKDWILLQEGDWITLEGEYTTAGVADAAGQLLRRTDGTFYVIWKNQAFSNPYRNETERIAWVDKGTGSSMNRPVVGSDETRDWILLNEGDWITQEGQYYQGDPSWWNSRYFGQVKKDDEEYYIAWGSNASGANRQYYQFEPWKGILYVKAKEDFIGGNAIETNQEAWVSLEQTQKYYEDPTVNVHLLDMNEISSEVTVYLGDIVNEAGHSPLDSLKYFYENTEFTKLIADGGNVLNKTEAASDNGLKEETFTLQYAIGRDLTAEEWETLINGGEVSIHYIYDLESSKGPVGKFTFRLEKKGITGASPAYEEHEAAAACQPKGNPLTENCTDSAETYTLHITYTAYRLGENSRPQSNVSNGAEGPGTEVGTGSALETGLGVLEKNNVHKVHVISGEIEITKRFEEGLKDVEDQEFTFILHRIEDGEDTSKDLQKTITIPAEAEKASRSIVFENLRRGTYVALEATDEKYMVKEVTVLDSTNCFSTPVIGEAAVEVTFVIGNNLSNENVIGKVSEEATYTSYIDPVNGVYGAAEFTNREIAYEGEVPVEKFWDDGASEHIGSEVYVILYKDGMPLLDGDGNARILRLDSGTNWQGTFTVVLADAEDSVENYEYSVREVSEISEKELYGWHPAILENDGTTLVYYEKGLNDGDILGVQAQGYMVKYEQLEDHTWIVKNYRALNLPATGGGGTQPYIYSGALLMTTALIYGYLLKRKQKRRRDGNTS